MITVLENVQTQTHNLKMLKEYTRPYYLVPENFETLDNLLAELGMALRNGQITKKDIAKVTSNFDDEFLLNTLLGRALAKPNGYAGDYLFLDGVYTNSISNHPKYGLWDTHTQQHAAPIAVRNRKTYYKELLCEKVRAKGNMSVLNIVSGSGREILETYDTLDKDHSLQTKCVELDAAAIQFSKQLNRKHLKNLSYVHSNIFKFQNTLKYDFIWSAGLFDYLDDHSFIWLLKKFKEWQHHGGEIVIGNFNEAYNPSRAYMELLGDWYLIHRTESDLKNLAKKAGFKEHQIKVNRLKDNIVLYLHLQAD